MLCATNFGSYVLGVVMQYTQGSEIHSNCSGFVKYSQHLQYVSGHSGHSGIAAIHGPTHEKGLNLGVSLYAHCLWVL